MSWNAYACFYLKHLFGAVSLLSSSHWIAPPESPRLPKHTCRAIRHWNYNKLFHPHHHHLTSPNHDPPSFCRFSKDICKGINEPCGTLGEFHICVHYTWLSIRDTTRAMWLAPPPRHSWPCLAIGSFRDYLSPPFQTKILLMKTSSIHVTSHEKFSKEHLEDGHSLSSNHTGLALINGLCTRDKSCNVNEDTGLTLAYTIAHEIGHKWVSILCGYQLSVLGNWSPSSSKSLSAFQLSCMS